MFKKNINECIQQTINLLSIKVTQKKWLNKFVLWSEESFFFQLLKIITKQNITIDILSLYWQ
jgi:hypothetical protein